jgi:nucleotide-binding universal stress UspA family protein
MTIETNHRTIVVGYDGSPAALAAVETSIDRAGPDGHLVIVHAYQTPTDYTGASYYTAMVEDASQYATNVLDDLERDCERLVTIDHERDLAVGAAAAAIVRAAETHDAAEIVIGSRGVGRIRALLGSVAHDVIHRAHCPVIVIPERMVDRKAAEPAVAASAA